MDCSHTQFAKVWVQLEDAYRGQHGHGGDTAEIYLYLVQNRSPGCDSAIPEPGSMFFDEYKDREAEAINTIYEICRIFADMRDALIFWEDEDDVMAELFWHLDDDSWIFNQGHRVHIRVQPK